MYKRLVLGAAFFGIAVFAVNALAITFYWYASITHFDKLVHTLGGIFAAVAGSAFLYKHAQTLRKRELVITALLFVFIVGLAWEYYEYILQFYIKNIHLADIPDSIGDLVADMIGGILGISFVILLQKRYNRE